MLRYLLVRSSTTFYRRFNLPMVRSLSFVSNTIDIVALLRLAFTMAPPNGLTAPITLTRWIVLQKARRHPYRAPTPCKHMISGSISLPFRGSFYLSLTVLVHYRSQNIFSLGRWTSRIQSGFLVSRPTQEINLMVVEAFVYQAFTVFGSPFQVILLALQT